MQRIGTSASLHDNIFIWRSSAQGIASFLEEKQEGCLSLTASDWCVILMKEDPYKIYQC